MTEIFLIATAFGTAVISGTIGMAGGMLLLVAMSTVFPPATLIPLHGTVQFFSNASRTFFFRKILNWHIVGAFFFGGIFGSGLGSQLVVEIPEDTYRICLGLFILIFTWMPKLKLAKPPPGRFVVLGFAMSFLSLFAGATGPLMAPFFLREGLGKETLVGTKATCQLATHMTKMVVFAGIGFSFSPYIPLLSGMIIAVLIGNYIGKLLLGKVSQSQFVWIFKGVISLLALRLLWQGLRL